MASHEPSHREPDEVDRRDPELLDQRGRVGGEGVHVVARGGDLALALAAVIPGDAAVPIAEGGHLEAPLGGAPEEPVGEGDRGPLACILDVQLGAVDPHASPPRSTKRWILPVAVLGSSAMKTISFGTM